RGLFSLDIYWLLPSLFVLCGLWYSMLPPSLPRRGATLLKILVLSLPLTGLLFVGFPRVVMPWAIPRSSDSAGQIGFSDDMKPGQVAQIAANTQTAFRAKFEQMPFQEVPDLYWRAAVLNESKGLSWEQGPQGPRRLPSYEDIER